MITTIIDSQLLSDKIKKIILAFCYNKEIHATLNITFLDLFKIVWTRIINHEHCKEIIKILEQEMSDAECKCFTGRLSRLVNCLNGYYSDININIADKDQIGNIIIMIQKNLLKEIKEDDPNFIPKWKELVRKELIEREYDEMTIQEWTEHIN